LTGWNDIDDLQVHKKQMQYMYYSNYDIKYSFRHKHTTQNSVSDTQ